jgi:hypothetical protein
MSVAGHSGELAAVAEQARRVLRETVSPDSLKKLLDTAGSFDRPLWNRAVALGWPALAADESVGGLGLGWSGLVALAEPLGEANGSLPLVAAAVLARACVESEDSDLMADFAAPVVAGDKLACMAWTQPGEGGLPALPGLLYEGERVQGGTGITPFAAVADVALIVAREGQRPVLALAELGSRGVRREVVPSFDNARAVARLHFDDAPVRRVGGSIGVPAKIACLDALAALGLASEQLGGASACLQMAREHALARVAFGQPIGRFQAIKHKLADMYARIEVARGCIIDAVDAEAAGEMHWVALAAAARLAAGDAYDFAARENAQVHGGLGTAWEAMPHHYYRRARALAVEMGSAVYWRERLLAEIDMPMSI